MLSIDINCEAGILIPYQLNFEECPGVLLLHTTYNLFTITKTYEAGQEIRIEGIHSVPPNVNIILAAPTVTLANQITTGQGATVTIRPDGCN